MAVQPFSISKLFGRKSDQNGAVAVTPGNGTPAVAPRRPLRILSIDGGGIRGILPAMVLSDLERRTNRPIIDLFDLIVGTSTGGLVGLALACPDAEGKPRHTARDIVRLYEIEGKRVFSRSVWHSCTSDCTRTRSLGSSRSSSADLPSQRCGWSSSRSAGDGSAGCATGTSSSNDGPAARGPRCLLCVEL